MFTRDTASRLFIVGLRKVLVDMFKMNDWLYKKLFYVTSMDRRFIEDYTMYGINSVPQITEGQAIPFQDTNDGYAMKYTPLAYGTGLQWTIEADEDELYGFLRKFPTFLNNAMKYTIETVAHNIFNNGFTNAGLDAVATFATTHPCIDSTQSNTPAAQVDLGLTSLENALVALSKQRTWENLPIDDKEKKILLIHPDNLPMATKLTTGERVPFSANNTTNYLQDKVDIVSSPYVSAAKSWFLLPRPYDGGFMFFWRKNPYVFSDKDPDTLANRIRIRTRFIPGNTEWRGSYASSGS